MKARHPIKPPKKVDPRIVEINTKIEEAKTLLRILKDEKRKLIQQIEKGRG